MDFSNATQVGVACNSYLYSLPPEQMDLFDYIEVPFELLCHDPTVFTKINHKPLILHCASLSLGGYVKPEKKTLDQIQDAISITRTPWLGEHLSFITSEKLDEKFYESYAPGEPYNIGYTVSPVMNHSSAKHIIENINECSEALGIPIILENPPAYFTLPGSTLSQLDFINIICSESSTNLLLDLAHLYITAQNFDFDPIKALDRLPLSRVKEVHISGVNEDSNMFWDNHANNAPDIIFEMLEIVLKNVQPHAITLEYNWSSNFPWRVLETELNKTRQVLYNCHVI